MREPVRALWYDFYMERPHPSEQHKRRADRLQANARDLGNKALRDIDGLMRAEEDVWNDLINGAGCEVLSVNETLARIWNQRNGSPDS